MGGVWDLYELAPAFLVSIIFIYVVSLLTKEPSENILDSFNTVQIKS